MKIIDLLNARESAKKVFNMTFAPAKALEIRRATIAMEDELKSYEAIVQEWAKKESIKAITVDQLSSSQREYWAELVSVGVKAKWDAPLTLKDLSGGSFSAAELDSLIRANLLKED